LLRYHLLDLRPVARTLLVERTSDAMIVVDTDRRILDLNPAAERLVNRRLSDAVGEPLEVVAPELAAAIVPFRPAGRDIWLGPRDARRNLDVRVHGLDPTVRGEHLGHLIVVHDMTALREAQNSMRQSETMAALGTLMVGVAHEVRNPLFSLTAMIDVLQERFPRHEDIDNYVGQLRAQTQRIADVTSALLQYGKPVERERGLGDIEGAIREAVQACRGLAGRNEVELSTTIVGPLPRITMDRLRLVELFVNLIENAIHSTPVAGRIDISAAEVTTDGLRAVLCSVKDTGSGFRDVDPTRVFEPFYTSRVDGIGMGLAISQRIARDHEAEIVAYDAPGGGALVQVSFRLERNGASPQ
jgi:signal transduction histidine kinase